MNNLETSLQQPRSRWRYLTLHFLCWAVLIVVPMFFHKIKIDPAVASGPLITTVNDLVAVVTYYGLAWILLIHVGHLG